VIAGVWLFEQGRTVLSAVHEDHPRPPRIEAMDPMRQVAHRGELAELYSRARAARKGTASAYLWVDVVDPVASEMAKLADVFGLPRLQVEDALAPRQRPKVERSGHDLFVVLKALTYLEATSDIETHQVAAFAGEGFLVTVSHGRYDIADAVLQRVAVQPLVRRRGSVVAIHSLLDVVVDEYLAVANEIGNDIEQIEESVFAPSRSDDAAAIYALKRENLELRRAVVPLAAPAGLVVRGLMPRMEEELAPFFQDVADHLLRVAEQAENHDQLLMTMLMASTARQDLQQNADMRRISAYVALAAVPTLIAGIYGMNFELMPELDEAWGYPFALGLMSAVCLLLYRAFKRSGWL
jgi:magnesium transporter